VFFEDELIGAHLIGGVQAVFSETSQLGEQKNCTLRLRQLAIWGPTYAVDWLHQHLTTIPIFGIVFGIQLPHMTSSLIIVAN